VIFSLMGAVAGLVIGRMASRTMERSISVTSDFPIVLDFGLDWRVFAYALTAATLTGVAIAVWPTARASRANGVAALHDGARGSGGPGRQRVRALLAGGQVAGSLVLLIVAALFTRDLRNAATQDLGFDADHLLNVRMDPAWAGYDTSRTESFYKELEERIAAIPGVDSVGLAYSVPLGYYWDFGPIFVDGVRTDPDRQPLPVPRNYVSLRYFETMGIPLVEGRRFETTDGEADAPVAIVNEAMAARYWPGRSAVGQSFRLTSADGPALRVVGVAKNSKYIRIWERPTPYFYTPLSQYRSSMRVLQVRSSKALDQLAPLVEKEIRALGPDVPLTDVQTMREAMGSLGGLLLLRIGAVQATAMGLLGLALAVVGVYGVASYAAAQRTREIGLRIALGATARNILQMILRQGVMMVAGGTTAGLALALGMTAVLTSVLGMERAVDPLVFTLTTMLLCTVTLGACYLPARRATRIQPTLALRQE
jgi:predicted permease